MTMTPTQREAALRLADDMNTPISVWADHVAHLLRELAAEPQAEPVAWRSKERINGEFDSGWKLTSNEPPQTPRTIAIEPLYAHPPQQRQPQGEPVAWPARHVSLKQRKDKTLRLTLDLNAVEGWPNYWVMRSDSRGKCSTPSGCAAHGCHGECLQTAPPNA